MPENTFNEISPLFYELSISLSPSDYEKDYEKLLQETGGKMDLKGFRKGKVPASMLRRRFGKELLNEAIVSRIQRELDKVLEEQETDRIKFVGEPMPKMEYEEQLDKLNPIKPSKTIEWTWLIGASESNEVVLPTKEDEITSYVLEADKESIQKEIDKSLSEAKKQEEIKSGEVQDGDILRLLYAIPLDEEGNELNLTAVLNTSGEETLEDKYNPSATSLVGLTIEEPFQVDLATVYPDASWEDIKMHVFAMDKEVEGQFQELYEAGKVQAFEAKIDYALRNVQPTDEEEAIKLVYGEQFENREDIAEAYERFYEQQAAQYNIMLQNEEIKEHLLANNAIQLSDEWLVETTKFYIKNQKKRRTASLLKQDYNERKQFLPWALLKNKLEELLDIEVENEELSNYIYSDLHRQFGQYYNEEMMNSLAQQIFKNRASVLRYRSELAEIKIFDSLRERMGRNEVSITLDDLKAKVDALSTRLETTKIDEEPPLGWSEEE